jgi:hypothetical protein
MQPWGNVCWSFEFHARVKIKGDKPMSNFRFWQRWMVAVGIAIVVFGILMAVLSGSPLFDLFNRQIDPAFWGRE